MGQLRRLSSSQGWSLFALALLAGALGGRCSPAPSEPAGAADAVSADASTEPPVFTEITEAVGLSDTHGPWPDGSHQSPEIMQGGVALLDYDADGDLDLLHVRIPLPGQLGTPAPNRLYRQEGDGRFVDLAEEAGIADPGFGAGVAVGDVDNDGDPDVLVTNLGPDGFYRNNGDGSFTEATAETGLAGDHWSTAAAFCDYDRDGHLDLYLVQYLRYDPDMVCLGDAERQDYCGPQAFHGEPDRLFHNNGDGTFADVTAAAGISPPDGGLRAKGLGVLCVDLTDDGWVDFFVANDGESNHLWVNQRDGTFVDEGIVTGVAVSGYGTAEASMGITIGDVDGDGGDDLFVTHLRHEHNRLYMGRGNLFTDRSQESHLSQFDLKHTGFGCGLFDYDHDGDLDLAVVNGAVGRRPQTASAQVSRFWQDFAEPNQIFENNGEGIYSRLEARAGAFSAMVEVSRALAFGDLDRDGDLDLVLGNVDNSLRVYRNDAPRAGTHWLQVRALTGPRDAHGARVSVIAGETELRRWIQPAYSYLTSNQPWAHFGLGPLDRVEEIRILWPDGRTESFPGVEADRLVTLHQGTGSAP